MNDLVFEHSAMLRREGITYALATIIDVRGSASARPGSKAVISQDGKNLAGWVGGGCAESYICAQALESIVEQKPRIVTADLDDEIFGLGMPCGGVMDVYIEPIFPPTRLNWPEMSEASDEQRSLAKLVHWHASHLDLEMVESPLQPAARQIDWSPTSLKSCTHVEQSLLGLAHSLALARGRNFESMTKPTPAARLTQIVLQPRLWITGKGRITEELARFGAQLEWPVTIVSSVADASLYPLRTRILTETAARSELLTSQDFVVIASHHKGDPEWIEQSLHAKVAYVGLIASRHRVNLIVEDLKNRGLDSQQLQYLRGPAGLDLDSRSPGEIALSVIAEMLTLIRAES